MKNKYFFSRSLTHLKRYSPAFQREEFPLTDLMAVKPERGNDNDILSSKKNSHSDFSLWLWIREPAPVCALNS